MQLPCSKLNTICGFPALHSVAAGAPLPVAFECRVYRVVPSGFSINGQRTSCLWKVTRSFLPCMPCFSVNNCLQAAGCVPAWAADLNLLPAALQPFGPNVLSVAFPRVHRASHLTSSKRVQTPWLSQTSFASCLPLCGSLSSFS